MNKLFTKIATLLVGSMMAIGVGVAIGNKSDMRAAVATAGGWSATYSSGKFTNWTTSGTASGGGGSYCVLKDSASIISKELTDVDLTEDVCFVLNLRTYGGASYKTVNITAHSGSTCVDGNKIGACSIDAAGSSLADSASTKVVFSSTTATSVWFKLTSSTTSADNGPGIKTIELSYTVKEGGGGADPEPVEPSNSDNLIITAEYLNIVPTSSAAGYTTETTLTADDAKKYVAGPADKCYANTVGGGAENNFSSEKVVFIGKNGSYFYNKTAMDYNIVKCELYQNVGGSTKVTVAIEFDDEVMDDAFSITDSNKDHEQKIDTVDSTYDFTYEDMSAGYKFFRLQVTNANNLQFQLKLTLKTPHYDAATFETNYVLKPGGSEIAYPVSAPTGIEGTACLSTSKGGSGYYDNAVEAYADLSEDAKIQFASNSDFTKARERLIAWAAANGSSIEFNTTTGAIQPKLSANSILSESNTINNSTIIIIIVVSSTALIAVGGYFLLRRKHDDK